MHAGTIRWHGILQLALVPRRSGPALLKSIEVPGLALGDVMIDVRNDVLRATSRKQVPWDNSSLRGDIYLAGLPGDVGPADPSRRIETLPAPPQSQPMKPANLQPPANAQPVVPPIGKWSDEAMRESFVVSGAGSIMTGQTVVLTARNGRKMTCVGGSITQHIPRRCSWH